MTVRTRLVLMLAGITGVLLLPGLYGASRLAELSAIAESLSERHAPALRALGAFETALAELDRHQRSYVVTRTGASRERISFALERARAELDRLIESGHGDAAVELAAHVDEIEAATFRIEDFIARDRLDEATRALEEALPLIPAAHDAAAGVAGDMHERRDALVADARDISIAASRQTLLAAAGSAVLALLLGLWTTGALTTPLRRLRTAMATVAGGRFVAPLDLPYRRQDEIGDLATSFRAMTQQLAELERLKAEFVSMASHELKTPLNVIGGYVELIEEGLYGDVSPEQTEVLRTVEDQVRILAGLVDELLDISRIEAGGLRVEPRDVSLRELFEEVERAFEPLARQKGIDFAVAVDDAAPGTIRADSGRLRNEVLGNLLSNAFKFTPAGGRITVRVSGGPDTVHIEVRDTGIGIPADELPHIFEKFYQVGERAREMGTGLGLSIAKQVVKAHGGSIAAESEPGAGTTFRIRLPAPRPAAAAAVHA